MKLLNTFFCILGMAASLHVSGQSTQGITAAELRFAKQAREENTRIAFLSNLDSNGVIFNRGKAMNGIKIWQRAPENGPKLLWLPALSHTSAKGDLGFTTGPFEMRDSLAGPVIAAGQYTSVWKRNAQQEWKLIADLGTGYTPTAYPAQVLAPFPASLVPDTSGIDLYNLETNLQNERKKGGGEFDALFLAQSVLNKEGQLPVQSGSAIVRELTSLPANVEFTPLAAGMAQSRDFGYVYGQVKMDGKTENYLNIWGHTAKGWVVLVHVIKL